MGAPKNFSLMYFMVWLALFALGVGVVYSYLQESLFIAAQTTITTDLGILDSLEWVLYATVEFTGFTDVMRAVAKGQLDSRLLDLYGDMGGDPVAYLKKAVSVNFEFNQSHIVQYMRSQNDIGISEFEAFYTPGYKFNSNFQFRAFSPANSDVYTDRAVSKYELYKRLTVLSHEFAVGLYSPSVPASPSELALRYNSLNPAYSSILEGSLPIDTKKQTQLSQFWT